MSDSSRAPGREFSRAEVLGHIRRLADGDTPPAGEEFKHDDAAPSLAAVYTRFGTWNEAVEAAGFDPRQYCSTRRRSWSDAEILDHIQRLADGDTPPTRNELDDDDAAPSGVTVYRRFGGWNEAVKAAGLDARSCPAPGNKHSRDELIDWLVAYRCEFGRWPSADVLAEWPGPSEVPFRRAFGGIPEAREAAAEVLDE